MLFSEIELHLFEAYVSQKFFEFYKSSDSKLSNLLILLKISKISIFELFSKNRISRLIFRSSLIL